MLTPAQFSALSERSISHLKFIDKQLGWLRAICAAPHRRKQDGAAKISQFVEFEHEGMSASSDGMTPEEQLEYIKTVVQPRLGGELKSN